MRNDDEFDDILAVSSTAKSPVLIFPVLVERFRC